MCGVMLSDRAAARSSSSRTKIQPICSGSQWLLAQGELLVMNMESVSGRVSTSEMLPSIFMVAPMVCCLERKKHMEGEVRKRYRTEVGFR